MKYSLRKNAVHPLGITLSTLLTEPLAKIADDKNAVALEVDYDEAGNLDDNTMWFIRLNGASPIPKDARNKVLRLLKPSVDLHDMTDSMLRFAQSSNGDEVPEWTLGQDCLK